MVDRARSLFKAIYKAGMILVTLTLAGLAILAYLSADSGNGLLLISGILALLTLIAGLSISKLDDMDARGETYRQIGGEIRNLVKVSTYQVQSEPEVYRVDAAGLEDARRMASEGVPIDDICRAIDPAHGEHDPLHQQAFRKIVQAMIAQA